MVVVVFSLVALTMTCVAAVILVPILRQVFRDADHEEQSRKAGVKIENRDP